MRVAADHREPPLELVGINRLVQKLRGEEFL
jgi:hypothetical protein